VRQSRRVRRTSECDAGQSSTATVVIEASLHTLHCSHDMEVAGSWRWQSFVLEGGLAYLFSLSLDRGRQLRHPRTRTNVIPSHSLSAHRVVALHAVAMRHLPLIAFPSSVHLISLSFACVTA
jgi:hypothetical protein